MENISQGKLQNLAESFNEKYFNPFLKIVAFFILLVFFIVCIFYFLSGKTKNGLETSLYISKENGFIFNYPRGWKLDKEKFSDRAVFFSNPLPDILNDNKFLYTSSIGIDYGISGATVNELKESFKTEIPKEITNFKIEAENDVSLMDEEGKIMTVAFVDENSVQRKMMIYFIADKNKNNFVISGSSPSEVWSKYEGIFKKCLLSFEITK